MTWPIYALYMYLYSTDPCGLTSIITHMAVTGSIFALPAYLVTRYGVTVNNSFTA